MKWLKGCFFLLFFFICLSNCRKEARASAFPFLRESSHELWLFADTPFRQMCCLSQLSGMSGHRPSHQSSDGYSYNRWDWRGGRALTLSHPPQSAIKWEETGPLSPLLLWSPSSAGGGRWIAQCDPSQHTVCYASLPSYHRSSHLPILFCGFARCQSPRQQTSEPPSAASWLRDSPPCSPCSLLLCGLVYLGGLKSHKMLL